MTGEIAEISTFLYRASVRCLPSGTWKGCGNAGLDVSLRHYQNRGYGKRSSAGEAGTDLGYPRRPRRPRAGLDPSDHDGGGPDRLRGDLVGYGPFPDPVVAFLQERQIPSVRGNHDRWALAGVRASRTSLAGERPAARPWSTWEPCRVTCLRGGGADRRGRARLALQRHGVRQSRIPPARVLRGYLRDLAATSSWSAILTSPCGIAVRRADWWSIPAR